MKKYLLLIPIVLALFSCDKEEEEPYIEACMLVAEDFFQLYDPYKAYMDIYEREVEQGIRTDSNQARISYYMDDPQQRFKKVDDFAKSNEHLCADLKAWGRNRMRIWRLTIE